MKEKRRNPSEKGLREAIYYRLFRPFERKKKARGRGTPRLRHEKNLGLLEKSQENEKKRVKERAGAGKKDSSEGQAVLGERERNALQLPVKS